MPLFKNILLLKLLCHIGVLVCRVCCSLDVLFVYQHLDALLDDGDCWSEPRLALTQHLLDQSVVLQQLPWLHDSDDGCLEIHLPVLLHCVMCWLYLLRSLLLNCACYPEIWLVNKYEILSCDWSIGMLHWSVIGQYLNFNLLLLYLRLSEMVESGVSDSVLVFRSLASSRDWMYLTSSNINRVQLDFVRILVSIFIDD